MNKEITKQAKEYAKIREQSVMNGKTITIVNEVKKQAFIDGATNICKKILEEVKNKNIDLPFGNQINYFALEEIIKDLGVDL